MVWWFKKKPKLTSITPEPPGFWRLLFTRTFLINPLSTLFHFGMVLSLITGVFMETLYLVGYTGVFGGTGWTATWTHGIFGILTTIGFIGVLGRFSINKFFRLAEGKMFYVDAAFISVVAGSGILIFLQLVGIMPLATGWFSTIHITSVITWIIISLFGNGLLAHAFATTVYTFNARASRNSYATFQAFNSACGRCGKCAEVCPVYKGSNDRDEDAPALKVRKYLSEMKNGVPLEKMKQMTEDIYTCSLCGLCVGVCPYSFRHYDLYTTLLGQVKKYWEEAHLVKA
jgi:ferredoxin